MDEVQVQLAVPEHQVKPAQSLAIIHLRQQRARAVAGLLHPATIGESVCALKAHRLACADETLLLAVQFDSFPDFSSDPFWFRLTLRCSLDRHARGILAIHRLV